MLVSPKLDPGNWVIPIVKKVKKVKKGKKWTTTKRIQLQHFLALIQCMLLDPGAVPCSQVHSNAGVIVVVIMNLHGITCMTT